MPPELQALMAGLVAALACACAVPQVARLARRTGIIDRPGGYKQHERPTPYLGGAAVLLGVVAATLITVGLPGPMAFILAGAALICLLGTLDDRSPIAPGLRLAGQAAVAAGIWAAGAGWALAMPDWANLVLTVGWVLLAANAFNLIDNLDGTSAGAAGASALGVTAVALFEGGAAWPAVLAAAVLGACLGFLPFNLARPARIFLGDGGSTLVGFLLAVAVMGALPAEPSITVATAAILLIGMTLLDTTYVFISRARRGVPLLTGGRDHLTHRLQARLGSARAVTLVVVAGQAAFSALAVAAIELGPTAILAADAIYCLAVVATVSMLEIRRAAMAAAPAAQLPQAQNAS
jgi:UDP-GlcNAc:undecaprenyl-phosphate GlcNAc-1-phosphate transferase